MALPSAHVDQWMGNVGGSFAKSRCRCGCDADMEAGRCYDATAAPASNSVVDPRPNQSVEERVEVSGLRCLHSPVMVCTVPQARPARLLERGDRWLDEVRGGIGASAQHFAPLGRNGVSQRSGVHRGPFRCPQNWQIRPATGVVPGQIAVPRQSRITVLKQRFVKRFHSIDFGRRF